VGRFASAGTISVSDLAEEYLAAGEYSSPVSNLAYTPTNSGNTAIDWPSESVRITSSLGSAEVLNDSVLFINTGSFSAKYYDIPGKNLRVSWDEMKLEIFSAKGNTPIKPILTVINLGNDDKYWNSTGNILSAPLLRGTVKNVRITPIDKNKSMAKISALRVRPSQEIGLTNTFTHEATIFEGYPWESPEYKVTVKKLPPATLTVLDSVEVAAGAEEDIGTLTCNHLSSIAVTTTMSPERLLIDGQPWQSGDRISCSGTETKKLTVKGPSLPLKPGKHTWTINFDYYVL
ncbi:hypothetical protein WN774_004619, partial [Salmonella enterica subsp. enterica serovar Bredeney]